MFAAPPDIATEVFSRLPDNLRIRDQRTDWSDARGGSPLHSFLEGPSFDREGNLYCVDVCHGRIFRIDAKGNWEVFADYDGNPNGLKIHRDGRIFVADRIRSCAGIRTTNVAFGIADDRTVFITEAEHGVILRAQLPVAGRRMFSHS